MAVDSGKLGGWMQILTTVGVLVGLGLVIWELQQVKTLSRAQLSSDYVNEMNSIYSFMVGEQPMEVVAKACLEPQNLTLSETLIVEQFFLAKMNLLSRMMLLSDRDGVYPCGYWRGQMNHLNAMFSSEYGRAWFSAREFNGWPQGFSEAAQEYLEQLGPPNCKAVYEQTIEHFRSKKRAADPPVSQR